MPTAPQVEKMAKEADEIHRSLYPDQYPGETPPTIPAVPPDDTPPDDAVPPPQVDDATPAPPDVEDGTPVVDDQIQPDALIEEPVVPAAPDPFEARYRTLQGKYDAEVPRLHASIADLKLQLARVLSTPAPATQPTPSPAPAISPLNLEKILSGDPQLAEQFSSFKEDYPDVANLLVKITERASAVTRDQLTESFDTQVRSVQDFQAETRGQLFWNVINSEIPEWETVKNDPDFAIWLSQPDPYSGVSRGQLAQDALQRMDAPRVVNFYKGFQNHKKTIHPPDPTPDPIPSPDPTIPTSPAAALISPPSGKRTAPPAVPRNTEPPITKAYITKFYQDAALGHYKTRQKEFLAIEAKIDKAVARGDVQ